MYRQAFSPVSKFSFILKKSIVEVCQFIDGEEISLSILQISKVKF